MKYVHECEPSNSNHEKIQNPMAHFKVFYLCIMCSLNSPVHVRSVSHAFNPFLAEHVQSLRRMAVKGHMTTHLPNVNQ